MEEMAAWPASSRVSQEEKVEGGESQAAWGHADASYPQTARSSAPCTPRLTRLHLFPLTRLHQCFPSPCLPVGCVDKGGPWGS